MIGVVVPSGATWTSVGVRWPWSASRLTFARSTARRRSACRSLSGSVTWKSSPRSSVFVPVSVHWPAGSSIVWVVVPGGGQASCSRNTPSVPSVITGGADMGSPLSVCAKNVSSSGWKCAPGVSCAPWNMYSHAGPSCTANRSMPSDWRTLKSCQPWTISAGTS